MYFELIKLISKFYNTVDLSESRFVNITNYNGPLNYASPRRGSFPKVTNKRKRARTPQDAYGT
jgi:hypothetical protein